MQTPKQTAVFSKHQNLFGRDLGELHIADYLSLVIPHFANLLNKSRLTDVKTFEHAFAPPISIGSAV